jgi:Na+/phosphate symporter
MDPELGTPLEEHLHLADCTIEMLKMARELFIKQERRLVDPILQLGQHVHRREKFITAALAGPADGDIERFFVPMHYERVGDNIEAFTHAVERMIKDGVVFTDRAIQEIDTLISKALELLDATRDVLRTSSTVLIRHVLTEGPAFEATASEFALFHQGRLIQGLCRPKASSIYLAMIDYLGGIERHQREIVQKIARQPGFACFPADRAARHDLV